MPSLQDEIDSFLDAPPYDACLLLVHPEVRRLASVVRQLQVTYGWPCLALGRELSVALLYVAPRERARAASQWLDTALRELAPRPVLCTEVDLLFEPTLELDALKFLRQASRVTRLIVAWPGNYVGDTLTYAVPQHAHYRVWWRPDVRSVIIS